MPPIHGTPAPVRTNANAQYAKARTGLMRMIAGAQYRIVTADGEMHCEARSHLDLPPNVSVVFFCQHERCAGKTWKSFDEMRNAHAGAQEMAKKNEAHVYGMWSDSLFDPNAVEPAKEALAKAQRELAEYEKAKTSGKAFFDKRVSDELIAAVKKAEADIDASKAVIGLIAPPDLHDEM